MQGPLQDELIPGIHVSQVQWLPQCHSLKLLWLRNFHAQKRCDEVFLFGLPMEHRTMTWRWTGSILLCGRDCSRLEAFTPRPTLRRDQPLPSGVILSHLDNTVVRFERKIGLENEVMCLWRDLLYKTVNSDQLAMFFDVTATCLDRWHITRAEFDG